MFHPTKFIVLLALIAGVMVLMSILRRLITSIGQDRFVNPYRIRYVIKSINLALVVSACLIALAILGIDRTQVLIFTSSIFAIIGVALFAQWSILSNITSSVLIFFAFPYRVGDSIRVIDKDENVCGVIEEISLFHVLIRRKDDVITYPNSLMMQRGVIKYATREALDAEIAKSNLIFTQVTAAAPEVHVRSAQSPDPSSSGITVK